MDYPVQYSSSDATSKQPSHAKQPPAAASSPLSSHRLRPMTYCSSIDVPRPNHYVCVDGRGHEWISIYLLPCLLLSIFLFPFGLLSVLLLRFKQCRKCGRSNTSY
ncbi:hypothetical protein SYNPS1DRAFT_30987 [Syncephalis pseudoplumigaleata]|uniref:Brain protein I3 n=1 Tax=Syncephalis pseudoplumigaleata TaxID=1712513 RepID=A0A4P9YVC1_9FUNG|nr:hypothetical protein SYNPS1DRAFT_31360 [Syncephalis pseudoplumigaleata]RKP23171.1 hypothetical protein SYNPS1DRAFT_31121 [Syncephalis pseudoplumigaleata]RKP23288.1 hypothetical protein SYNPS1DRAFT_30987 [Syncephalis pseudoplumigaleata]|eukprot:RKP22954.1 hypothetical protein SYNPS1DRAFT_31360 [Syncephalis pseudoplumigaleata]